jgi:hypothetical protein
VRFTKGAQAKKGVCLCLSLATEAATRSPQQSKNNAPQPLPAGSNRLWSDVFLNLARPLAERAKNRPTGFEASVCSESRLIDLQRSFRTGFMACYGQSSRSP